MAGSLSPEGQSKPTSAPTLHLNFSPSTCRLTFGPAVQDIPVNTIQLQDFWCPSSHCPLTKVHPNPISIKGQVGLPSNTTSIINHAGPLKHPFLQPPQCFYPRAIHMWIVSLEVAGLSAGEALGGLGRPDLPQQQQGWRGHLFSGLLLMPSLFWPMVVPSSGFLCPLLSFFRHQVQTGLH